LGNAKASTIGEELDVLTSYGIGLVPGGLNDKGGRIVVKYSWDKGQLPG